LGYTDLAEPSHGRLGSTTPGLQERAIMNQKLWLRIALVASVAWLGGVVIVSQIGPSDFRWFPYSYRNNYDFGPAGITAIVGVVVILAVCLGIPWIGDAADKPDGK
jgi:hypothetical protein